MDLSRQNTVKRAHPERPEHVDVHRIVDGGLSRSPHQRRRQAPVEGSELRTWVQYINRDDVSGACPEQAWRLGLRGVLPHSLGEPFVKSGSPAGASVLINTSF